MSTAEIDRQVPFWRHIVEPFGIDLRTLALFRICFGLVLIGDLVTRAFHLTAHYTDVGVMPREAAEAVMLPFGFSLHMLGGSTAFQGLLFIVAGILAGLLIVGYRTRLVSVLSWLMLASLNHRNYLVLQSSDTLMLALLFWSLFLPLGARWSVDAALASGPPRVKRVCNFASAALILQVLYVYFFGALLKTGDAWRVSGDAVHVALHFSAYASPIGVWLVELVPAEYLRWLTWYTWYIELWGPLLVLLPVYYQQIRLVVVPGLILLHVGFIFLLVVGIYPFVSITSLLLLVPSRFWDLMAERLRTPEREGLRIYYDSPCDFCRKTCLLLRSFLLLDSTPILPAQGHPEIGPLLEQENSWVVEDHVGRRYLRWGAMLLVLRRSWLPRFVTKIFETAPLHRLGEAFYQWVGKSRPALSRCSSRLLPYRDEPLEITLVTNLTAGALMVLILWLNVAKLRDSEIEYPWTFTRFVDALMLSQHWTMFAPEPGRVTRWIFVDGELAGGKRVDVYNLSMTPPSLERPSNGSGYFDGYRWRKYFSEGGMDVRWPNLSLYYCHRWNSLFPHSSIERVYGYQLIQRTQVGILEGDEQWEEELRSLGAVDCP